MSQEDRFRILEVIPELAEKATLVLESISQGKHLQDLCSGTEMKVINLLNLEELHPKFNYDKSDENQFIREKDGTMLLNQAVSDLQKKAFKSVLGQIAKKILKADMTGITLPIFLFEASTYLQK